MAVGKSVQLARALRSMATRIPVEDVKRAAKEIASCLSNVLTVRFFHELCKSHCHLVGDQWSFAATDNSAGCGLQSSEQSPQRL